MKTMIVGAGTMGAGIAQVFAMAGHTALLFDIDAAAAQKGFAGVEASLGRMAVKGRVTAQQKDDALKNLAVAEHLEEAKDCDLIVEAIAENMDAKQALLKKLDGICGPDTVFATNTSSLSVSKIASAVQRGGKVAGMHFFNPAPVMKLVEVIRAQTTTDETVAFIRDAAQSLGKQPVSVNEAPGFVVNRLLIPMINEAVGILAEGVAAAQDIDLAMQLGANHPIGPLALADLIGNDVNLAILQAMFEDTGNEKYRPHPLLAQMVAEGKLGRKTGHGFFKY